MERQSGYISIVSVLLAALLATTAGQDDLAVSFKLSISSYSPPQKVQTCIGGDVGLTETSVLAQYRPAESSNLGEWEFLKEIDLNQGFNGTLLVNTTTRSIQFRLLQVQHGGGGCNCWQVNEANMTIGNDLVTMGSIFFSERCFSVPTGMVSVFCGGSASRARGFISEALRYNGNGYQTLQCPGDSGTTLISRKQPISPSSCPTDSLAM